MFGEDGVVEDELWGADNHKFYTSGHDLQVVHSERGHFEILSRNLTTMMNIKGSFVKLLHF